VFCFFIFTLAHFAIGLWAVKLACKLLIKDLILFVITLVSVHFSHSITAGVNAPIEWLISK
jgi:uncharacterized membrane protein YjdF